MTNALEAFRIINFFKAACTTIIIAIFNIEFIVTFAVCNLLQIRPDRAGGVKKVFKSWLKPITLVTNTSIGMLVTQRSINNFQATIPTIISTLPIVQVWITSTIPNPFKFQQLVLIHRTCHLKRF